MDEEDHDDASDTESREGDGDGNSSTRSASPRQRKSGNTAATDDDGGSNLADKGQKKVFSADHGHRSPSLDMPEISIRRRTRIAGVGDNERNEAGSRPSSNPGTIVRASMIITELEQDHGGMEFPLDALRGESTGYFGDDDNDNHE